jgi:hypothetical protein
MTAILFAEMAPEVDWEQKFNKWYDEDHIRSRMQIPGFEGAQRYRAQDGDNYLIIYDMNSLAVLKTPEYEHLRTHESEQTKWMLANVRNFTRNLGTEIGRDRFDDKAREAPLIFATMFNVPAQHFAEFDEWMTQDHAPLLLKNEDWLGIRRFHMTLSEPHPFTRLSVHYLASPAALQSPERAAARGTPWRARMAEQYDWFREAKTSAYNRHGPFYGPTSV